MTHFLSAIFTVLWIAAGALAAETFHAIVHDILQCNGENSVTHLDRFVANRVEGNDFELNGTLIVRDDIPGPINVSCVISRCLSEDKPDSCEYFATYNLKNFCEEIAKSKKPWSNFIDTIKIKKECPLQKGTYHIKKYRMNLDILQPLVLSRPFRVFWKIMTKLDSPKYPNAFCMNTVCSLEPKNKMKPYRKKSK